MPDPTAQRTLVKSPPELWAEVSDAASLARHLGELGDIRITRLEPETTVAWEGDRASGTVSLEASGWGTRVTLTASARETEPVAAPEPEPAAVIEGGPEALMTEPEPAPDPEPLPEPTRLPERDPDPIPPAAATVEPLGEEGLAGVLAAALDTLGSAHHRPFSR
jgi:hypothetical protein